MKKHLLLLLMALMFAPWAMNAQETLTVCDGTTTNSYVPIYGLYVDTQGQNSEFIIPAETEGMSAMEGGEISKLAFYISGTPSTWGSPTVQVYMGEVEGTTLSSLYGPTNFTTVWTGTLSNQNATMEITLSTPYTYEGGNLLIGMYVQTGSSTYQGTPFYGIDAPNGSSMYFSGSSYGTPTTQSFLPKTTFTYEAAQQGDCAKPTGLAVNYTGGTTATVTWNGDANSYNVELNGAVVASNVNGNSYPLSNLSYGTTYEVRVMANCDGTSSDWSSAKSFITDLCAPENMCELTFVLTDAWGDSWNGNAIRVVDVLTGKVLGELANENLNGTSGSGENEVNTKTLAVCDGREIQFVWVKGSYPGEASWVILDFNGEEITSGTGTTSMATGDILATYTMSCTVTPCKKPTDLAAANITGRAATLSWTENGEATAWNLLVNGSPIENVTNPYTLTGLTPETMYTVQVSPVCEVEKWSDEITFTTDVACPAPTDLSASDVTPNAATLNWTGSANQYIVKYRPMAHGEVLEAQSFEGSLGNWTTIDADGDGFDWTLGSVLMEGYVIPAHEGEDCISSASYDFDEGALNPDNYLVSPQVELGGKITFWACAQDPDYPAEHFGVAVSTTDNTDASAFTTIAQWTMNAKRSSGNMMGKNRNYKTRSRANREGTWYEFTVDLSDYDGQIGYVAIRHFNCSDLFYLDVDEITIEGAVQQAEWTSVTVNDNHVNLTNLTEDTEYEWQVQAVCGGEDGSSAWTMSTFTTPSNCDAPIDLNVTNLMPTTATLNWTGYQDNFEVWYRPVAQGTLLESIDFEDSSLGNWTTIDADGDGYDWMIATTSAGVYHNEGVDLTGYGHDESVDFVTSGSYTNYGSSALTPDNYLVSPQVELGGTIEFWACAQDASYAAEVFGVAVSTTGNTDAEDFTTIQQWTMTAKAGNWYKYTVDLSDYAGQNGYVAIRHFDCTDQFMLNVDDITIYGPVTEEQEWIQATADGTTIDIEGLESEVTYEWQVQGINTNCEDGVTGWSELVTFTTPGFCDNPIDLVVTDTTATSATLSWTGYQESFNLRYRESMQVDLFFYEDFTGDDVAFYVSNLGEGNNDAGYSSNLYEFSDGTIAFVFFGDTELTAPQYLLSYEMAPTTEGTVLQFGVASSGDGCVYKVGFSSTDDDPDSFTWSDEITPANDYVDYEVPEGTTYFAIAYPETNPTDGSYTYFLDFIVYANYVPAGEWITIEDVTSPYTLTGLNPETEYDWEVQGVCEEGVYTGWVDSWFTTPVLTEITQTIALTSGLNWVSFYVQTDLDAVKAALVAAYPGTTMMIQGKNAYTLYNGTRWRGSLSSLDLSQMYKIDVTADGEIVVEAEPINPAELPVTVNAGDNWIGFPFSTEMTVTNAFAGFAVSGDMIQAKNSYATYNGTRWRGSLSTLVPGQGYIYTSATDRDDFYYPTGAKKASNLGTGNKTVKKAFNMPVIKKQNLSDKKQIKSVKKINK